MADGFDDSQFDLDNNHNKRERCLGIFYNRAVLNKEASDEAGRPIYEDKVYIRIVVPGDKDEVDRLARDEDKERFPDRWKAFNERQEAQATGTPTGVWHEISPSQVAELAAANVTTVDQLALLPDDAVQRLGPGYTDIRKKAQQYITMRDRAEAVEGLKAIVAEKDARIAELEAEVDRLSGLAASSTEGKGQPKSAAPKKGGGKKKKSPPTSEEQVGL